ncbi:MAG: hypothetical protein KAH32_01400 [Chlamydiia bacterium]|nr:hypothetical protein [Chlamydiia bacterium]
MRISLRKNNKRSEILATLINIHLKSGKPVNSMSLYKSLHKISSQSSIRHHLQELVRDGFLLSVNGDTGKIPTDFALQNFANTFTCSTTKNYNENYTTTNQKYESIKKKILDTINEYTSRFNVTIIYQINGIDIQDIKHIFINNLGGKHYIATLVSHIDGLCKSVYGNISKHLTTKEWDLVGKLLSSEATNTQSKIIEASKEVLQNIMSNLQNEKDISTLYSGLQNILSKSNNKKTSEQIGQFMDKLHKIIYVAYNITWPSDFLVMIGKYFNFENQKFDDLSIIFSKTSKLLINCKIAILDLKQSDYKLNFSICNELTSKIEKILHKFKLRITSSISNLRLT